MKARYWNSAVMDGQPIRVASPFERSGLGIDRRRRRFATVAAASVLRVPRVGGVSSFGIRVEALNLDLPITVGVSLKNVDGRPAVRGDGTVGLRVVAGPGQETVGQVAARFGFQHGQALVRLALVEPSLVSCSYRVGPACRWSPR